MFTIKNIFDSPKFMQLKVVGKKNNKKILESLFFFNNLKHLNLSVVLCNMTEMHSTY